MTEHGTCHSEQTLHTFQMHTYTDIGSLTPMLKGRDIYEFWMEPPHSVAAVSENTHSGTLQTREVTSPMVIYHCPLQAGHKPKFLPSSPKPEYPFRQTPESSLCRPFQTTRRFTYVLNMSICIDLKHSYCTHAHVS